LLTTMEGEEAVGGVLSVDTTVEVTVLVSAAYPTVVKQNSIIPKLIKNLVPTIFLLDYSHMGYAS